MRNWFEKLPHMKRKVTELHFYLHDIVAGPNPTNIPTAIDDLLTTGPSPNSTIVGRAKGLFGSTSLDDIGFHMTFNIVFTNGKYNGSTLSLIGHNPFLNEFRELPIVGGSGVFRLARGLALLSNLVLNNTSGDAVVEYNVVVLHY
ncbi:dirigent protein 21 [Phtheirospermum japonicum]|uniref:Dirigent protein n=1 Tax=Phtheirospermum japonicum TaxID=374723 RepID=A0A830BVP1_9LAMI|nr:dirigent protein 21 [Phtheirospermum japonicum]